MPQTSAAFDPRGFTALGGAVLFHATEAEHGRELWRSDGTAGGTVRRTDLRAGNADGVFPDAPLFVVGNKVLFLAVEEVGPTVQASDGSALWFVATTASEGAELWRCDGTGSGTGMVIDLAPGSVSSFVDSEQQLRAIGGSCWFRGDDGSSGSEPWASDGTAAGTRPLADLRTGANGSHPRAFARVGNLLLFAPTTVCTGRSPSRSRSTGSGHRSSSRSAHHARAAAAGHRAR